MVRGSGGMGFAGGVIFFPHLGISFRRVEGMCVVKDILESGVFRGRGIWWRWVMCPRIAAAGSAEEVVL